MTKSQRLLVLSDTHGETAALAAVLKWAKSQSIEAAVFLGDCASDLSGAGWLPGSMKMVRGNSDFNESPNLPEAALMDFAGRRIFLCHGHRHSLGNGFSTLAAAASSNNADAALFGHTHVPFFQTFNGLFLLNPGSVGKPRSKIGATFAVIECAPDAPLTPAFYLIAGGNCSLIPTPHSLLSIP